MMRSMLFSAAIAVLLSANGAEAVRSVLYPADWKPGFADAEGNWLPDFPMPVIIRDAKRFLPLTKSSLM